MRCVCVRACVRACVSVLFGVHVRVRANSMPRCLERTGGP